MQWLGDFPEDATVYIPFNTFTSDDPQASSTITNLADADIKVHKDGGLTQIATDGATVVIDYDSITGNHLITVDTSAHADYSIGSDYLVRIEGTTVDAGTVNAWVGSFSIENRFDNDTAKAANLVTVDTVVDAIKVVTDKFAFTVANQVDSNGLSVGGTAQTANDNGADINTILGRIIGTLATGTHNPATAAQIAVLSDWINGGRLDLLLDAIPTTAMRGTDSAATATALATAQTDLDKITGSDGATLATTQGNYAPAKAGDNMGTVSSVTGNVDGSTASVAGAVGSVTGAVGSVIGNVGGNVAGSVGSNLELGPAEVNAEVVDVMKTDTISEMTQQAPPTTPTFEEAVMYLYMALVHKGDATATLKEFHNNAGTVIWKKTLSDDGTTYSEADGVTGP